jgi:endonuclease/exonuclease/phosphatase family metal-dependent hydrolase
MLNAIETFARKLRRGISRNEWLVRLLHLSRSQGTAAEPGLVLIQIDGLSRPQMEEALAHGRLPFLARLIDRHGYRLHSHYSGLPSSTPAMQAELFYGVKCAVPAFSFYDRQTQRVFRMFQPRSAEEMERRLMDKGQPLLAGGSAFCDIFSGGAAETSFCFSRLGLSSLFHPRIAWSSWLILMLHAYSLLRAAALIIIEFFLAIIDCFRGIISGANLAKEIKFIPSRVGISILMREMATIGAVLDVARGLPIIHLDFIGYDEQSHRRGPSSRFAHWSLKGIDDAIQRVWRAAHRSQRRDYDVWIYSDHGNEETLPYPDANGRTIEEAVAGVFDAGVTVSDVEPHDRGIQARRMPSFGLSSERARNVLAEKSPPAADEERTSSPIVAAMGPVGHIYIHKPMDADAKDRAAQALLQVDVPMVLVPDGRGRVYVYTRRGRFLLPDDAPEVFGSGHPFLREMAEDLVRLCHHPNAGDFVICGYNREGPSYSFPLENGSHAGPGPEETHAFALLPGDALPADLAGKPYLRPLDLRTAVFHHLGQTQRHLTPVVRTSHQRQLLRVMTYNVHSCVGIDGRLSPKRVARVIARYQPDVVALQEVDVGRWRTDRADQAQIIAGYLEMEYHFHAVIQVEEEAYGDCILSRLPMRLVRKGILPTLAGRDGLEPRGAVWVAIDVGPTAVHVLDTHLGLKGHEKWLQTQALLGPQWIGDGHRHDPVIVCGDFNSIPGSNVWRLCAGRLRDVQIEAPGRPQRTWCGHFPLLRIDHIFVSPRVRVIRAGVGDDYLSRIASDHRPLFAELEIT